MFEDIPEPSLGERWAYRASYRDPMVEVEVVRLGSRKPKRLYVKWVDDDFEGLTYWVPPARLKVPWNKADEYSAWVDRWEAVVAPTWEMDETLVRAVSNVIERFVDPKLAEEGWRSSERDVLKVHDVPALAAYLGIEPERLWDPKLSFEEDGDLISPITIGHLVTRRTATRYPHAVLAFVEEEEARARHDAVYGRDYRRRGGDDYVTPEICRAVDADHSAPVRAILREWCGAEPADVRADIAALREQAARVGELARAALDGLRDHGLVRIANRLEREFEAGRHGDPWLPPSPHS